MRVALACVLAVSCSSESRTEPPEPAPAHASTPPAIAAATPAQPSSPAGTAGLCRTNPKLAGIEDRDQPAAVAYCPDPMEMVRGNGMPPDREPAAPPTTPPWDQDALRDYACAYACAAAGSHAYLVAWQVIGDTRAHGHEAVYFIEHGPQAGAPKWTVVSMYKRAFNAWWNINTGPHVRTRPIHVFDHRPTPVEIRRALIATGFGAGGTTIDENWTIAFGGPPPTDDR